MIVANIITDLIEELDEIAGNWWFLFVIFGIAFLDSVIPVVPSETAVILGGLAAYDHGVDRLLLVIVAGASGAFLGDNFAYLLGHRFRPRVERFASTRPKLSARLDWARTQIRTRGGPLLVTARFIPGGRTALTITSGLTHQPRRWFASWIGLAAVIWATYASLLGYIGKDRFKDNHTAAFLFAFGAAVSITVVIEIVRHVRSRGKPEPGAAVVEEVAEAVVDEVKDAVSDGGESHRRR
jgi:membrane protein DedA with SNARE-associated domain